MDGFWEFWEFEVVGYNQKMENMNFGEAGQNDQNKGNAESGASEASADGSVENEKMVENNSPAPKAPEGNSGSSGGRKKKLIWAGIILAILILAVVGWQYWQYTQTPYYQQMKMVKAIDASLKESDKWGGKTPEETVALFTEAVKKGDFELAGKYGNADLILPVLEKMKTDGKINDLVNWLEDGEIKMFVGENDANLIIKENGQEFWVLSVHKSDSGTWKIDEF
ncbi:MAG: hypothetical protein Q8P06_00535 [Candidatus Azambacteria bacterium]|nr:hypothetical protein [Candidatus Azambacteria bacterium]